jgi:hypothetical protein
VQRPFADQQHVVAVVHHQARELHGVCDVPDRGHGARRERAAVHDPGIHFHLAVLVQYRATAGVEPWVVLEQGRAGLDPIHGGTAFAQDGAAVLEDRANAFQVARCDALVPHVLKRAGAAMNHQGEASFHGSPRGVGVECPNPWDRGPDGLSRSDSYEALRAPCDSSQAEGIRP